MRRTFAIALGAALAGALVLTSISVGAADRSRVATLDGADPGARLAARASDKYKGRFKGVPGSKIKIKAKTEGGVPTKIKRMSYVNLPASCPASGATSISGGWTLVGTKVDEDRKFKAVGTDGDPVNPSSLRFKGKFTADFDKVKGRFQTNSYFTEEPVETCVSENRKYVAKR